MNMNEEFLGKSARLLYGSSEDNADILYFSKAFVPDAFIALEVGDKKLGLFGALEYGRMVKESDFDSVLSLEDYQEKAKKRFRKKEVGSAQIIKVLAEEYGINHFLIAEDFPVGLALDLKKAHLKIQVLKGSFFPQREIKSNAEALEITQGNAASAAGILAAETALRRSTIKGNQLYLDGKILSSEHLRELVDIACLQMGAIAHNTIVAGGDQACDPHCRGSGPLRPNELIIVDVFPRLSSSGYHGDMTRTFLKGQATEAQKKLVFAVQEAQKKALSKIKEGITGAEVHGEVTNYFLQSGYITKKVDNKYEGFFHGTGHGLGLDVHETPRVNGSNKEGLKLNTVITVEPGLYYPGVGGCRIEDVVQVNRNGYKMLSDYHYAWQID